MLLLNRFKGQSQKAADGAPTVESLTKRQELILDRLSALQSKVASIAAKMGVTLVESAASINTQLTG